MPSGGIVWFPRWGFVEACQEADRAFKLETGGILLGYWNSGVAVVTDVIGPGPKARHFERNFEPDDKWHAAEIADRFSRSGGQETYLGDWHTHPGTSFGLLSRQDKVSIKKIIATPEAHTANPLSAIVFGNKGDWNISIWKGAMRRHFLIDMLCVTMFRVEMYS